MIETLVILGAVVVGYAIPKDGWGCPRCDVGAPGAPCTCPTPPSAANSPSPVVPEGDPKP